MNSNDIAYAAKVNAAAWLIRKARKIARRLTDATPEQRHAIESEIVDIGMRLYSETCEEKQPEVTPEPGGDYQLGLYANAVVELDASVDMWFIENDYNHGFTPEQTVRRWRDHLSYSTGQDHELEAYIAAVRELVPDADRSEIEQYRSNHGISPEETAKRWKIWKQVQAFTEQQRKGVNP